MQRRGIWAIAAAFALAAANSVVGVAKDGKGDEKDKAAASQEVIVEFGVPNTVGGTPANHFLVPDEVNVMKGGTVVFRTNQGGHGVSVYRVSDNTTRENIQASLCPIRDNCGPTSATPNFVNEQHLIFDGDGNLVIDTGTNPPRARVDDTATILVGSAAQTGDDGVPGRFHAGVPTVPPAAPAGSERIRVRFTKGGRYLVICMNRNHSLNDWMFGFVNVADDDKE